MKRKPCFGESLHIWITCCWMVGLFPYHRSNQNFVKSKCARLITLYCFTFYAIMDTLFNLQLYFIMDVPLGGDLAIKLFNTLPVVTWIVLGHRNNDSLVRLFNSLDEFDDSFKKLSSRTIPQKKPYQLGCVQLLFAAAAVDSIHFTLGILARRSADFILSLEYGTVRFLHRSGHFLFLLLYYHIIESLRLRFEMMKIVWHELVETKIQKPCSNFHLGLSIRIDEFKSSYNRLLNIIDDVNDCLGSRLAVLFVLMFYYALMYFYLVMRNSSNMGVLLVVFLIYAVLIVIQVAIKTHNLISSADFIKELVKLPTSKVPEKLLVQLHGFLQQLRVCPIRVSAGGFFSINWNLLSSILMALASYLVAIFQLTPLIQRISTTTKYDL